MKDETLYSSKRLRLPAPHFLVFYNGTEEREECSVLKLSDSFEYMGTQREGPNLELKVLVLNINQGKNKELLEACRTLRKCMIFVDRIRLYTKTMELDAAAERAVDECIHEGVLSDFLRKNRGDAIETVCTEGKAPLPSPSPHVILISKHIFLITGRFMAVCNSNNHFRKSMLFQK